MGKVGISGNGEEAGRILGNGTEMGSTGKERIK